jgi:MFS family permease
MPRQLTLRSWFILFAAFCILTVAFSFPRFSLPQFYPALVKQFHWTHASAVAGGSIVLLLIGIFSPVVGWFVDKFSPKSVLLAGIAMVSLSLVLLSTTSALPQYYTFCLLLGLGISAVSILPTSLLVAPWFSTGRGTAVGVINAGIGLGGFIAPLLANAEMARHGMAATFLLVAAWMALPFLLTLIVVPGSVGARDASHHRPLLDATSAASLLRMPMFWIFGVSVFLAAHAMTAVQENLILYLRAEGLPGGRAALALSTVVGASAPGKILSGFISDRHSSRLAAMLSIACVAIAIIGLLSVDPHSNGVYLCAVIFGMGFGGIFNAPPMIVFEYFGTRQVGAILGLFLVFFGLGTSSGGILAGYLYDRTRRYDLPFSVDLALASVALVLLAAGRRQTRVVAVAETA